MRLPLFFLLIFVFSACSPPVEIVEGESDMTQHFKPLEWGQTLVIKPGQWQEDRPISVVTKDPEFGAPRTNERRPFVKNVTLATSYDASNINAGWALRWLVTFGVGGGSATFEIDANSLQQFSLSADTLRISIVSRYVGIVDANGDPIGAEPFFAYSNPNNDIEVNAFFAEGMTATDSPTLTQRFTLDGSGGTTPSVSVPVPKFASSFRLLGNPYTVGNPFTASQKYILQSATGADLDVYKGDELLGIRLAPVPTGEAPILTIINSDVAGISGSIEWELDL